MSPTEPPVDSRYRVAGMTCLHCARRVTDELSAIEGVTDVGVDLASGDVRVTSVAPLAPDEVQAAIEEAGYELVS